MSIVNLIIVKGHLVAALDTGYLVAWSVDHLARSHQDKLPLLANPNQTLEISNRVLGFEQTFATFLIYNERSLFFIEKMTFFDESKECQISQLDNCLPQGNKIRKIVVVDNNTILIAADKNSLLKYRFTTNQTQGRVVMDERILQSRLTQKDAVLTVNSMVLSQQGKEVIVAMSNNRLYCINVQELTVRCCTSRRTQLPHIISLSYSLDSNTFFTIHEDYILGWKDNIKKPDFFIEVSNATQAICLSNNSYAIIGYYPTLSLIKDGKTESMGLSMRCGTCLKRMTLGGREFMFVGGNSGMVDVFQGKDHRIVFYTETDASQE